MSSSHLFHLDATEPSQTTAFGSRTDGHHFNFPVLKGMSLSLLKLKINGVREPHWHPNANELGYCIEGKALMTIFNPGSGHSTFILEPGSLAFVPMGSIHHLENIGDTPVKMLVAFDHESPEELGLSSAVGAMPISVLSKTFQVDNPFFSDLHAAVESVFITEKNTRPVLENSWKVSPFKFDIETTNPQVSNRGGSVKMSNSFLMPTLHSLALYCVRLSKEGAREPHWHPNANELNYLISGSAKITLLSPKGDVDTFEMKKGDMSFLPQGYLHHIENTGDDPAHFAIFFNHTMPSDIGISGCLGAYTNKLLSALFAKPEEYFDKLPKYQSDLLIVGGG